MTIGEKIAKQRKELNYTQDDRSGCKITKSLDFSMFLRSFDLRQKKNICKFRLYFRKSVQTFNVKVVCPKM